MLLCHRELKYSLFYGNELWAQVHHYCHPLIPILILEVQIVPYAPDLIQFWEEHRYIFTLSQYLRLSKTGCAPTFRFDRIYAEIFSKHPDVLFVTKTLLLWDKNHPNEPNSGLYQMFELLELPWNFRVFQPFLEFREVLALPFPDGDSPVDFLNNPRRAGIMYSDPDIITEELVLRWIHRAKELLISGGQFWRYS